MVQRQRLLQTPYEATELDETLPRPDDRSNVERCSQISKEFERDLLHGKPLVGRKSQRYL